ncbi:His-Xaa-Ser system radical SAM maturase HxsB [Candidatus Woesearchaeota archaeon]|nr:His-Xaa-Ser system radical SAM maturase HxsB [Candidatus Woesearchaeota archaeon]
MILPYQTRTITGKNLVTTRLGTWIILTNEELSQLCTNTLEDPLRERLTLTDIIITEENRDRVLSNFRRLNANLGAAPSLHIICVTDRCNHNCTYCHASSPEATGVDMSIATANKVLDVIFSSPAKHLTIEFQGGETMINWMVVTHIVTQARRREATSGKHISLVIVSNLSLIDNAKLEFLSIHQVAITTSLDGPASVHDANRPFLGGGRSTHKSVMRGIELIQNHYKKQGKPAPLSALCTTTRASLAHGPAIVDEYARLGFEIIHLRPVNPVGIAKKRWDLVGYTADEFIAFWKTAMDHILKLNRSGIRIIERQAFMMLQKILAFRDPMYLGLMNPSGAGRCVLTYNYDGKVYASDEARMIGEDIFCLGSVDLGYEKLARDPIVAGLVQASILDNTCGSCPYIPWCGIDPVLTYAAYGSIIPQIPLHRMHQIHQAQFDYLIEQILTHPDPFSAFYLWLPNLDMTLTRARLGDRILALDMR